MSNRSGFILAAVALASLASLPARAQFAVVDVRAVTQLVQQVQAMEQQVQTAQSQLLQARQALATMTGDRGMELLLSGVPRNYLPTSWSQLAAAMAGGGAYPGLGSLVRAAVTANAVLTPTQLNWLSAANQQQILAGRQTSALQQAVAQTALANVSGRFADLQRLVAAIGTATDQKAILDLQARINAELGMLQNEQSKLLVLAQLSQAQTAMDTERQIEQNIAAQGNFASRFAPTP